ncbi:MAG TPA: hypothetical protein VGN72_24340 [Tepidisphaeraceae bacterium]|jgi:hypothetical protein|nr:hypothetical protein [Tepidisphaeraceae bacterium]
MTSPSPKRKWQQVENPELQGESIFSTLLFRVIIGGGIFGGMALAAVLFPEAPQAKFAVAGLVGGMVGYVLHWAIERWRGDESPLFDRQLRAHWMLLVGIALAFGLSVTVLIASVTDAARQAEAERVSKQERDAYYEKLRSPEVKRGMEAYGEIKAARERAKRVAPATLPTGP